MERWGFARQAWEQAFAPLGELGFRLERVLEATYWETHERELREHFPPEAFIMLSRLRDDETKAKLERIEQTRQDHALRDFTVVRDGDAIVATFCGEHLWRGWYRMWHTHVHPDYRRKGVYKRILQGTIAYTKELGFDTIVSEHAPGNNPVLLAKLGAGFRIVSMEVDPSVGVSVKLSYFHNPDHLAAYEFRCGLATLNQRILQSSFGAMKTLSAQFAEAAIHEPDSD